MIQEALLIREADRVSYYIDNHVTLAGAEKREEVLDLFDTMHRIFPHWVITTCPMMHPDLQYISRNCHSTFGYDREYLVRHSGLPLFMTHIHENDQQYLYECFTRMHNFLAATPPEEHYRCRAVFHYRFRNADGRWMYLHDEKAALNLRGSGILYYVLFRDITEEKTFGGVRLEILRQDEELVKVEEFRPGIIKNPLTRRERELVGLISQGLSTKEIAVLMGISPHTVRNIKSKLFEKYNVSNSIELINMTV